MNRPVAEVFEEIATWTNVADELSKRGITGTPECNDACPMAVFILSSTDRREVTKVAVDSDRTEVWNWDGLRTEIENPPNMREFIPAFDEGDYRDLCDDPSYFDYLDEADWDDFEDYEDPFDGEGDDDLVTTDPADVY